LAVNRALILLAFALPALLLGGCGSQQRTITVTSDPAGALCYLNDIEIGRTPCDTEFKFYGIYDVRLIADGYEPLQTSQDAEQPFNEFPVIDLATAALPGARITNLRWHYVLTPKPVSPDRAARAQFEEALVKRAQTMRQESAADQPIGTPIGTPETPSPAPATSPGGQ